MGQRSREHDDEFWRPSVAQRLHAQREAKRVASASAWRRNLTGLVVIAMAVISVWLLRRF